MSPRAYRLGRRRASGQQTRDRIIGAARELLLAGLAGFTVDAVARQAGVARMTVYYQFGSKLGLLEALFDHLAGRGLMERLPAALAQSEPLEALDRIAGAFGHFWASDRVVLRRIRGLAALDQDIEEAVRARDERRREHLRIIVRRIMDKHGRPLRESFDEVVDVLHTLTSFETFDALAGDTRAPEEVEPLLRRLARAALGLAQE